ncbi:MAG: hypothetical protein IPK99_14535 [Flavobacteriales bacterium]|nr:hypothetical protein [Flavobacteriales bacterium]
MKASPHPITRKDLDRLAVPAIISGIAEPLISLVDTAFVGRLGTADLAAVGISSSFFLLVVWVLAQTRSAVLSVVARYYGEQRLDDVKGLVPIAVWMNFGLGLLFYLATAPVAESIFRWYNAEGAVLKGGGLFPHPFDRLPDLVGHVRAHRCVPRHPEPALEHVDQLDRRRREPVIEPTAHLRLGTCGGDGN